MLSGMSIICGAIEDTKPYKQYIIKFIRLTGIGKPILSHLIAISFGIIRAQEPDRPISYILLLYYYYFCSCSSSHHIILAYTHIHTLCNTVSFKEYRGSQ